MGEDVEESSSLSSSFELRFRNYVPKDRKLRQFCLPRPSIDELEKQIALEAESAVQAAKDEVRANTNKTNTAHRFLLILMQHQMQ